jgi:hypothetical protein
MRSTEAARRKPLNGGVPRLAAIAAPANVAVSAISKPTHVTRQ